MNLIYDEKKPLQDHCGIFAIVSPSDTAFFTRGLSGIKKLQTRGYDGAGLGAIDTSGASYIYKGEGLVDEVFRDKIIKKLAPIEANIWLFQVRYGTVGSFSQRNVQPLLRKHSKTKEAFIVIHNGQFSPENGEGFRHESDTLYFARQLSKSPENTWDERIVNLLRKKRGAWSLAIGTKNALYLARDILGVRPLTYGYVSYGDNQKHWIAASETSSLLEVGVKNFFEVLPGEVIRITREGPVRIDKIAARPGVCIFENVYIMKGEGTALLPRTNKDDINTSPTVDAIRSRSGIFLAKEAPLSTKDVDMAVGVPGTGITGGEAYAHALGIPYRQAITDKVPQDDQRTFMYADIDKIYKKVLTHFNFDEKAFYGKRVVLVDDSVVRGNITSGLVSLLRKKYGVKSVHIRVLCPPIDKACYLGINTRQRRELLAAQAEGEVEGKVTTEKVIAKMAEHLGADSLAFLSSAGLRAASTGNPNDNRFCMGCMIGHLPPVSRSGKLQTRS